MGALLALVSSLSWGVADFMGGLASRRAGAVHVLAVSYPSGAVVLTLIAMFVVPGHISGGALGWGVAAGLIGALAIGLLYRALSRGPMGIVSPVTAVMAGAVPVLVGVARGESLSTLALIGIACAGIAVVLVSRETGEQARVTPSTIVLALGSGVCIGLYLSAIGLAPAGVSLAPGRDLGGHRRLRERHVPAGVSAGHAVDRRRRGLALPGRDRHPRVGAPQGAAQCRPAHRCSPGPDRRSDALVEFLTPADA